MIAETMVPLWELSNGRLKYICEKYILSSKQILQLQKYSTQIQKWTTELGRSTNKIQVAITSSKVDLLK